LAVLINLRAFAIILLSSTLAACGSDAGRRPDGSDAQGALTDGGGGERPAVGETGRDLGSRWTLTDGGECVGPMFGACTLDEQPCGGQTSCRSCNAGLGLWKVMPVWLCVCASATVNGSTGLYWQCPSIPVCTPGPDTFVDSQCTEPVAIDAGLD
jgi:hypothetical protein